MRTRYLIGFLASAGAASAVLLAPAASADPSLLPECTTTGTGGTFTGTTSTQCASPGNVQITATAPDPPVYAYPWDDEFYGAPLIMGRG